MPAPLFTKINMFKLFYSEENSIAYYNWLVENFGLSKNHKQWILNEDPVHRCETHNQLTSKWDDNKEYCENCLDEAEKHLLSLRTKYVTQKGYTMNG